MQLTLRRVREDDAPLVFRIFASTRSEEFSQLDWSEAQKEAFLRQQFAAQTSHYATHFGDARFEVIECDLEAAGRLIVWRGRDEVRLIDIALLPGFRGRGIGERLVRAVLDEAAAVGLPVRIHVERSNPARRLYDRLGFVPIGEQGLYFLLEWRSATIAQTKTAS